MLIFSCLGTQPPVRQYPPAGNWYPAQNQQHPQFYGNQPISAGQIQNYISSNTHWRISLCCHRLFVSISFSTAVFFTMKYMQCLHFIDDKKYYAKVLKIRLILLSYTCRSFGICIQEVPSLRVLYTIMYMYLYMYSIYILLEIKFEWFWWIIFSLVSVHNRSPVWEPFLWNARNDAFQNGHPADDQDSSPRQHAPVGGQLQPELHAGPADVAEATTPPHGAAADPTVFSEPQPGHDHRWHTGNVLRTRDAFNEPVPELVSKLYLSRVAQINSWFTKSLCIQWTSPKVNSQLYLSRVALLNSWFTK